MVGFGAASIGQEGNPFEASRRAKSVSQGKFEASSQFQGSGAARRSQGFEAARLTSGPGTVPTEAAIQKATASLSRESVTSAPCISLLAAQMHPEAQYTPFVNPTQDWHLPSPNPTLDPVVTGTGHADVFPHYMSNALHVVLIPVPPPLPVIP